MNVPSWVLPEMLARLLLVLSRARVPLPLTFHVPERRIREGHVIVAASTVAIVAIAAAVFAQALLAWYILPRGGRRKRTLR
jgi:hypothetical protein